MSYDLSNNQKFEYLKQLKNASHEVIHHFLSGTETQSDAARIRDCASRLRICSDDEYGTSFDTWFCKHRHCPICQWRKSLRYCSAFHRLMDENQELLHGKWIYLTLTVRNCHVSDLQITLQRMNDAFRRMTNRDFWNRNVLGGIRFTEINDCRIDPEAAHPHFHCLLLVRPSMFAGVNYITEEQWSIEWQQALQVPYAPHVKAQRFLSEDNELKEDILKAVTYSMKPRSSSPVRTWFLTMSKETKWRRQVEPFGVIRSLLANLSAPDQLEGIGHRKQVRTSNAPTYRLWDLHCGDYRRA